MKKESNDGAEVRGRSYRLQNWARPGNVVNPLKKIPDGGPVNLKPDSGLDIDYRPLLVLAVVALAASTLSFCPRGVSTPTGKIEWVPIYPVGDKTAVLIDGDSSDADSIPDNAIDVLRRDGFGKIMVAQAGGGKQKKDVSQYDGTAAGVDALFGDLAGSLKGQENSLVFVYSLGGTDQMGQHVAQIKEAGARVVWVSDDCFDGKLPPDIIDRQKAPGIALSLGKSNISDANCVPLGSEFFAGLERFVDLNGDGVTETSEVFESTVGAHSPVEKANTFVGTNPELTLANFDRVMSDKRPILIMVGPDWCPACALLDSLLERSKGFIGEKVRIVKVTSADVNRVDSPDYPALMQRLKVSEPDSYPQLLVRRSSSGAFEEIMRGSASDLSGLLSVIAEKTGVRYETDSLPDGL
jgi:thiol-disulfide isomerase/thioredoxin